MNVPTAQAETSAPGGGRDDSADAAAFTHHPALRDWIGFLVGFVVSSYVAALVAALVQGFLSGRYSPLFGAIPQLLAWGAGIVIVLAPALYLWWRSMAFTLDADGLTAPGPFRRVRITWNDVGDASFPGAVFLPTLKMSSADGAKTIYALALGLDHAQFLAMLIHHAGIDHPATRAVAADDP
jgi:hypothetical protein